MPIVLPNQNQARSFPIIREPRGPSPLDRLQQMESIRRGRRGEDDALMLAILGFVNQQQGQQQRSREFDAELEFKQEERKDRDAEREDRFRILSDQITQQGRQFADTMRFRREDLASQETAAGRRHTEVMGGQDITKTGIEAQAGLNEANIQAILAGIESNTRLEGKLDLAAERGRIQEQGKQEMAAATRGLPLDMEELQLGLESGFDRGQEAAISEFGGAIRTFRNFDPTSSDRNAAIGLNRVAALLPGAGENDLAFPTMSFVGQKNAAFVSSMREFINAAPTDADRIGRTTQLHDEVDALIQKLEASPTSPGPRAFGIFGPITTTSTRRGLIERAKQLKKEIVAIGGKGGVDRKFKKVTVRQQGIDAARKGEAEIEKLRQKFQRMSNQVGQEMGPPAPENLGGATTQPAPTSQPTSFVDPLEFALEEFGAFA